MAVFACQNCQNCRPGPVQLEVQGADRVGEAEACVWRKGDVDVPPRGLVPAPAPPSPGAEGGRFPRVRRRMDVVEDVRLRRKSLVAVRRVLDAWLLVRDESRRRAPLFFLSRCGERRCAASAPASSSLRTSCATTCLTDLVRRP